MDKKLLVSLMMTAPVAAFAQSNWTAVGGSQLAYSILPEGNTTNWSPDALVDLTVKDGALVCPVSVAYLSHNAVLPVGTWAWNCESLSNAIIYINNVAQVKRNDKGQAVDKDGKVTTDSKQWVAELSFETKYDANTTLNIQILPQNNDLEFSVGKLTMTLDFNFATVKQNLQDALDAITLKSIEPYEGKVNDRQQAKDLNTKKGQLESVAAGIQGDINKISGTGEQLWSAYTTYQLNNWNADSKKASDAITVKINNYAGEAKTYNADVDAENLIWKNIQVNTAALNALNNQVISLQAQLNSKKTDIDTIVENNPAAGQIGQYCKNATAEEIAAAQTAIDNYKAAITAAYADLTKTVNFTSQTQAISDQIAAIDYQEAINRWNNYSTFLNDIKSVQETYGKLFALCNNVYADYDVEDPTVYDDVIGKACVDLAKIYNNNEDYAINQEGGLNPDNKNIDDATADNLQDAQDEMDQRKTDMQAIYDNLADLVQDQENQLKLADAQIEAFQEALDAKKALTDNDAFKQLKPEDQALIKTDLDNWQAAIDALETEKDKEYKAHNLNTTENADYVGKVTAVTNAANKFTTDTDAKNLTAVLQLISDLENAKKYVNTNAANAGGYNLVGKFTETFANIQAAIDQYYKTPTASAKADIEAAIGTKDDNTGVYASCNTLVDAFKTTANEITKADAELVKFNAAIEGKTVVVNGIPTPAYNKDSYKYVKGDVSFTYADVVAALAKYKSDLAAIANGTEKYGNPFDAYQGAIAVKADIEADNYAVNVPLAVTDFENTVTLKNLDALTGLVSELRNTITTGKYAGVPGMPDADALTLDFDKDYKGYQNDTEAVTAVNGALGDATALAECDTKIQLLIDAYQDLYEQIKKAKANKDAYDTLVNAATLVQTKLTNFINSIDDKTIEPAATFFENEAAKIQTALNAENREILASYNGVTEVADQPDHTTHLNNLTTQIKNLDEQCVNNQKYYDLQIEKSKEVANAANDLIDKLKDIDDVPSNLQKYLDKIDDVKEELANLSVELTATFAKGESQPLNDEYMQRFQDLLDELNAIDTEENTKYKDAVIESNTAYLATQGVVSGDLDKEYTAAIDQVNEYRYDIKNAGYYDALMQDEKFVENHQRLQDCYLRITTVESQLSKFIAGLTTGTRDNYIVLVDNTVTVDGIKLQDLVDEYAAISQEVKDALAEVNTAATEVAKNYYGGTADTQGLLAEAQGYYNNIKDRLETAGLTVDATVDGVLVPGEVSKALATQTALLTGATSAYQQYTDAIAFDADGNATKPENEPAFILGMSGICDKLDAVIKAMKDTDAFVYGVINAQWNTEYSEAQTKLSNLSEELKNYTLANNPAADRNALNQAITEATQLNSDWSALTNAQRETQHPQYDQDLQDILDRAQQVVDAAKAQDQLARENNAALTTLNGLADEASNDIDELLKWSSYRPNQLVTINKLKDDLKDLKADYTADASVNDNLSVYEGKFEDLQGDIEDAYETVFGQEMSFANDLMIKARSAFNNAKVNGVDESVLNGYDEDIKKYRDELDALTFDYEDRVDLMDDLREIEDALAAIIDELEDMGKTDQVVTDTLDETIDALNDIYTPLNTNLANLKSDIETRGAANGSYGENAANTYGPAVDNLIAALNGIHSEYEAAGTDAISDADKYAYDMEQLKTQYSTVLSQWNSAIATAEKYFESDNAYTALIDQLGDIESMIVMAHSQEERYQMNYWLADYTALMTLINGRDANPALGLAAVPGERATLLNKKNAHSLTKNSKLPDDIITGAYNYIHDVLGGISNKVKQNLIGEIGNDIASVRYPGTKNGYQVYFHDVEAIVADLYAQLEKARSVAVETVTEKMILDVPVATTNEEAFTNYESVMEELQNIQAAVEEILKNAEAEKYIKGDIDEDGKITVLDIQRLISIVLDENLINGLSGKEKETADVNSDDEINIADVTSLINLYMSEDTDNRQMRIRNFFGVSNGNNNVRVEEVVGDNGLRRYAMYLSNEVAFAAGQFDIVLPDFAKVAGVTLGDRANALDVYVNENGESTRVLFTSLDNSLIEGNNGCVLFIDVEGNAELSVENVIFSDVNGNAYKLGEGTTNGINGIYESVKDGVKAIYNAAGQKLRGLTKGVNIIRNADGTTTKKIGK